MKVILASSSPFRRDLFKALFPSLYASDAASFLEPDIDEKAVRREDPAEMVVAIAEAKMQLGVKGNKANAAAAASADVVLTCDQVVVCRGAVREKPRDAAQAREFLSSYAAGEEAECLNGLAAWHVPSGRLITALDRSTVRFGGDVSEEMISDIVENDEVCMRTAGGFSVGHNSVLSRRVKVLRGSVSSVEGFPHRKIMEMLSQVCPDLQLELPVFGKIRCVLFDMDGLLLDTESAYTVAQNKVLARFGIKFSWEVKAMMMGRKALDAANVMIKHYGLQDRLDPQEFLREREEILHQLFPKAELMAGVERLVRHLKRHNVPMAIATSSHKRHYDMKTQLHSAFFDRMFAAVVTGDCVANSKPHPEIFQEAFKRLSLEDVSPGETLVFEDAPLGVEAAKAADMKAVLISEVNPDENLKMDSHLTSLLHFLPEQWGLPPFEDTFTSELVQ